MTSTTAAPLPLALDHLTLVRATPPELVGIARAAGFAAVSLFLRPRFFPGAQDLPGLADNASLRRETRARLAAEGVAISCVEGLRVHEALDDGEIGAGLDLVEELGGRAINTLVYDSEPARARHHLARLCEMSRARGIAVLLEFNRLTQVRSLAEAAALAHDPDMAGLRLQLDMLHHVRAGGGPAAIAALARAEPQLIAHVQVSDGPAAVADDRAYLREAVRQRMVPGTGEFALPEMLSAIPPDAVISAEVPRWADEAAGAAPLALALETAAGLRKVHDRARALAATRDIAQHGHRA